MKHFSLHTLSRRSFLAKSSLGLAGIIAAQKAPAIIIKSMLGADGTKYVSSACLYTAADYVQDGLVAMWDGIENVGWGVHDPNAMVWKDLVSGTYDATLTEHGRFGSNYFETLGTGVAADFAPDNADLDNICLEVGIAAVTTPNSSRVYRIADLSSGSNFKKLIWILDNAIMFGWGKETGHYTATARLASYPATYSANTYKRGNGNRFVDSAFANGTLATTVQAYNGSWPRGGAFGGGYTSEGASTGSVASKILFMRRYNRYLAADEVAANYAVDKARFGLP